MLEELCARHRAKNFYTVNDFAAIVGRSEFTVRQWANLGRIKAVKTNTRTGAHTTWVISHEELERFQREGLLPERKTECA
ncbi:MAG: helix-turn-helix domain-containing protein [Pirellulales bacterium]|nr:helix-turn-helix domain-containing protein [Pirellulales bacterium]